MNRSMIKMRFKGALMSFSKNGNISYRTTEDMPTKSAVVGLIANAAGYKKSQTEKLKDLSDSIEVYTEFATEKMPGRLTDFQMVRSLTGEGFPTADTFEKKGKIQRKNALPLIHKQYLTNGDFYVYVYAESSLCESLLSYIIHPIRSIYLGRKCCNPSEEFAKEISLITDESEIEEILARCICQN